MKQPFIFFLALGLLLVQSTLAQMPTQPGFVENIGQLHYPDGTPASDVLYKWQGEEYNILFFQDKFQYEVQYANASALAEASAARMGPQPFEVHCSSSIIEIAFPSAVSEAVLSASNGTKGKFRLPNKRGSGFFEPRVFSSLVYANVFPQVDLVFSVTADGLCKYDVVLKAGAHLDDIQLMLNGDQFENVSVDRSNMIIDFPFGSFKESIPNAFMIMGDEQEPVAIEYSMTTSGVLGYSSSTGIGTIPQGGSLVIDPIGAIDWGTFFAPPGYSTVDRLNAQDDGYLYAAGTCTNGALVSNGSPFSGSRDIWVAKFQNLDLPWQGTDLLWCTCLGGTEDEWLGDMDVCKDRVAICGSTASTTGIATDSLPISNGATGIIHFDGFYGLLDTSGIQLFGTYIGAQHNDWSRSVSFDCTDTIQSMRCYVVSASQLDTLDQHGGGGIPFQVLPLSVDAGMYGLLQRYDEGLLLWTTFYSSSAPSTDIWPSQVEVDRNGNPIIVVTGYEADSTDLGTYNSKNGPTDYVIASFDSLAQLNWARWYGTALYDGTNGPPGGVASGIAIGRANELYVGGHSWDGNNSTEAYISRIDNSTTPTELWRVELPTANHTCNSGVWGLSVDCDGSIFAVGNTNCGSGTGFSSPGAHQELYGGGSFDGYLAELTDLDTAATMDYTTYYGGATRDYLNHVFAEYEGFVYVCGQSIQGDTSAIAPNGNNAWALYTYATDWGYLARFKNDTCCPADVVIPDGTITSTFSQWSGQTIRVEGDWFIDADVYLYNCTVIALPGANIIVGSGNNTAVFTAENTHFSSCMEMWRGIRAMEDNGMVRLKDCTVMDAQFAVQLEKHSTVSAENSEFVNNYVSMYLAEPMPGQFNFCTLQLNGCQFYTNGSLKDSYPGQFPAPSTTGYAGILAHSSFLSIVSSPLYTDNVFHHLNYGIRTTDVGLTVQNARFHDIQPDPGYGTDPELGTAIYCEGYGGYFSLDQKGKGIGANDPSTFTNCRWGIYTESMSLTSSLNKMDGTDMGTGYRAMYSGGKHIEIRENGLNVRGNGIDLYFNDGASWLIVEDNDITFGHIGLPKTMGIAVYEMNGTNAGSRINGNTISPRSSAGNATAGILLSSASEYEVSGNTVTLTQQFANRFGINMMACTNLQVHCNSVTGQPGWSNNWSLSPSNQAGIRHSLGDNNRLSCNSVSLLRQGITFNGYSPVTVLEGNYFGAHDIGLLLTMGALIGQQFDRGNVWNGQSATLDAEWASMTSAGVHYFRIDPNQNALFLPFTYSPSDWFLPFPIWNYECASSLPQCDTSQVQGGGGERDQAMDEAVMQGIIQNGIYTEETQLTLAYELYRALLRDSTLYASGAHTADFITVMAVSIAEQLNNVEEPRKELYGLPPAVSAAVAQNEVDIVLLLDQIAAAQDELAAGGLTPAQIAALEADIDSWNQGIEALALYNETAITNADAAREVEAQLLESETGNISSTELIEQNAKAVNEIYLATIGRSGEAVQFNAAQAAALLSIAGQCPLIGGNPVYQARSLYSLVDDQAEFDDALLCIAAGFVVKRLDEPELSITVYPNPNRTGQQFFAIKGLLDEEAMITMQFFDAQGRKLLDQRLPGTSGSVDVSRLAQGLYNWVVIINGRQMDQGKVTLF